MLIPKNGGGKKNPRCNDIYHFHGIVPKFNRAIKSSVTCKPYFADFSFSNIFIQIELYRHRTENNSCQTTLIVNLRRIFALIAILFCIKLY